MSACKASGAARDGSIIHAQANARERAYGIFLNCDSETALLMNKPLPDLAIQPFFQPIALRNHTKYSPRYDLSWGNLVSSEKWRKAMLKSAL